MTNGGDVAASGCYVLARRITSGVVMPLRCGSVCCFLSLMICASASAATTQQIREAIQKGKDYLYSVQKDGNWEIEEKIHGQKTGQTAVVLYALLAAGESPNDPRLASAIDYLKK